MTILQQVVQVYRDTQSLRQTAEHFGKSSYWVRMRLAEAGETVNSPTLAKFNLESAQKMREEGAAYEVIAAKLGDVSHSCVRKRLLKHQRQSS